jgi:hypothetical protein
MTATHDICAEFDWFNHAWENDPFHHADYDDECPASPFRPSLELCVPESDEDAWGRESDAEEPRLALCVPDPDHEMTDDNALEDVVETATKTHAKRRRVGL